MRKFTLFFSLLLTLAGATKAQADVKPLTPEEICKNGRLIVLKAQATNNPNYMVGPTGGTEKFDATENVFVIVSANNGSETTEFYLKRYSDGQFIQKPATLDGNIAFTTDENQYATFTVTTVEDKANADNTNNDHIHDAASNFLSGTEIGKLIRFITTSSAGTTYLNCNDKNQQMKVKKGTGAYTAFYVYDAAELQADYLFIGYVGALAIPQKQANDLLETYYQDNFSQTSYAELIALPSTTTGTNVFDASYYYRIENKEQTGVAITVNDDQTLSGLKEAAAASQIWKFTEAGTGTNGTIKYRLSAQGLSAQSFTNGRVSLTSNDATDVTTFYMIDCTNDGESIKTYAFSQGATVATGGGASGDKALKLGAHDNITGRDTDSYITGWASANPLSKWYLKRIESYTQNITSAGWASLNLPFAVQLPEDGSITAYYATGDNANAILLEEVGNVIPAQTPVVIQGSEGSYELSILSEAEALSVENKFLGTLLPAAPANPENTYALGLVAGKAKFCRLDSEATTIAANKAYYETAATTNPTNALSFAFGEATGIETAPKAEKAGTTYYDLNGRRVLYPAKGIYVTAGGQKVLFK